MGRISALTELTSLASNDYLLVLDSSANIAKKITVANAFGVPEATWTATGETWVYASWTSGTRIGTITVPTDATTKYSAGMRIKISQSTGGTKYGIVVGVTSTLLTIFFPSGTTLNNETISTPYYSSLKAPYGFPVNSSLWSLVAYSGTSVDTQTINTSWQNANFNLPVGSGSWYVEAFALLRVVRNAGTGMVSSIGITTSSGGTPSIENQVSNGDWGSTVYSVSQGGQVAGVLELSSAGTIYLVTSISTTTDVTTYQLENTNGQAWIKAKCAYL